MDEVQIPLPRKRGRPPNPPGDAPKKRRGGPGGKCLPVSPEEEASREKLLSDARAILVARAGAPVRVSLKALEDVVRREGHPIGSGSLQSGRRLAFAALAEWVEAQKKPSTSGEPPHVHT